MSARSNKQTYPALYRAGFERITKDEIDQVFVTNSDSPRRRLLASHLRLFISKLESLGVKGELWIDGSFSTKNPHPVDIDLLLVISRTTLENLSPSNLNELNGLASNQGRPYVRIRWNCDLYVIESSDFVGRKYYENLFSNNPDQSNKKGIPVIAI